MFKRTAHRHMSNSENTKVDTPATWRSVLYIPTVHFINN